MKGQVADMLPALSVAPPDRTAHTARTTDLQSSKASRKGFSSVLQKLRETGGQNDRRRDDDTSSTRRADERAQVKATKTKDHAPSRTEQSESSVKRPENRPQTREAKSNQDRSPFRTEEGESSSFQAVETGSAQPHEGKPADAALVGDEYSGKDNKADSSSGTQTQALPIWSALIAEPTDATPLHQAPASNEGDTQASQGGNQAANPFSSPVAPSLRMGDSWGLTAQISEHTDNQDGAVVLAKARSQQPVMTPAAHSENGDHGSLLLTQATSPTVDNTNAQKPTMGQDAGSGPSKVATDSSGVTLGVPLQKDSHPSLDSVLKSSQTERPMVGSDHEGGEGPATRQIPEHVEGPQHSPEHNESSDLKAKPALPQGYQPPGNLAEEFNEQWQSQHDQRSDQAQARMPHTTLTDLQGLSGKLPDALAVGAFGSLNHGAQAAAPSSSSTLAQTQSGQSIPHVADQPTAMMMRTVVLSVAQPDLGQVNVRVAMTNDVVHTYLSTDRPEVGQFLLNGQDRLQSSLQMSGFDLGQFRVDIDRQGAGRSFQQGFSQGQQGQAQNQDSQWMDGERGTHRYDDAHAPLQRRLNLVA